MKKLKLNKKVKKIMIIVIIVTIILLIGLFFLPKLNLEKNHIKVNVFDEYQDIDYNAYFLGTNLKDKVTITNDVDTSKLGNYKVLYELKYGIFNIKKELKVEVVDNVAPEITLEGETTYNVCSKSDFKDPGYKANDNYDGDITNKVEVKNLDDKVEYIVRDSSNNETKKIRTLNEIDEEAPKITLEGNKTTYIVTQKGYSSIIKAKIVIEDKFVKEFTVLEQNDSFYQKISDEDYTNKLIKDSNIDTITGATITSTALKTMLKNTLLDYGA